MSLLLWPDLAGSCRQASILLLLLHWDSTPQRFSFVPSRNTMHFSSDSMWIFMSIDFRQDPDASSVNPCSHLPWSPLQNWITCLGAHLVAGNRFQPRLYDLPSNDPSWLWTQDSRNSTFRVFDSQTLVPDSDPRISDSNVIVSAYSGFSCVEVLLWWFWI